MADETTITRSAYGTCQAAQGSTVANGAFSTGTVTAIASIAGITGTQKDFPALDFKFSVTSGTPTVDESINIYRRPSDGTDPAPLPSAYSSDQYIGSVKLDDAAASEYYLYGVANVDQNDTFYWENDNTTSLDGTLEVRTRAITPGA